MNDINLPIPIFYSGKIYKTVEYKNVTAGTLADTRQAIQGGNSYKALKVFLENSIISIEDITEKSEIKHLVGYMSYRTAYLVAIKILLLSTINDGVEGIYVCPRCDHQIIAEYNEDPELDTSDHISSLEIINMDNEYEIENYDLEYPIGSNFSNIPDSLLKIESVSVKFPTLNHCIRASSVLGEKNDVQLQMEIIGNAIVKLNDIEVTKQLRDRYMGTLLKRMAISDFKNLNEKLNKFGLQELIVKTCPECDKVFKVPLNTANFFALSLQ